MGRPSSVLRWERGQFAEVLRSRLPKSLKPAPRLSRPAASIAKVVDSSPVKGRAVRVDLTAVAAGALAAAAGAGACTDVPNTWVAGAGAAGACGTTTATGAGVS